MPVEPLDLGTAVCRALMREMDDRPLVLELLAAVPGRTAYEYTSASEGAIAMQWCAVMFPLPDMISVRAHLKFWGMGIWDQAEISDDPSFPHNLFVRYPSDPAAITGPELEAELRAAVEKALTAAETDRERVYAEHAAKRNG